MNINFTKILTFAVCIASMAAGSRPALANSIEIPGVNLKRLYIGGYHV